MTASATTILVLATAVAATTTQTEYVLRMAQEISMDAVIEKTGNKKGVLAVKHPKYSFLIH